MFPAVFAVAVAEPAGGRVAVMLLAMAVLVAVIGYLLREQRRTRRDRLGTSPPFDRAEAVDDMSRLNSALWASGERFWDYDLRQRRIRHLYIGDLPAPASGATEPAPPIAAAAAGLHTRIIARDGEVPTIHPDDLPRVMQRLREHLDGEAPMFRSEHRMDLRNDGQWTWIEAHGRVVQRDDHGQPIRLAGTARDISASRNARHEQRITGEVMRSMNEAVAVLDAHQHFVTINPAFTRMTGFEASQVIGQSVHMLDSSQHDDAFFQRMREELEHAGRWSGEVWKVRRDGEEILCRIETNRIAEDDQRHLYVQVLTDITEQKRAEQELRYLANYDTLTSLPNRSLLSERLSRAIVRARREGGYVAVLFLDLDRFKDINDSLGHATGDRILRAAASRVQQTVGPRHTVARLSGDEFTVVLEDISSQADAEQFAMDLIRAFRLPLSFDERLELSVSPSIGISLYPDHGQSPADLLKHADTAMYQAKAMGRHTYQVYSESMDEKNRHRAVLASALRRALERNELSLVFQPRFSISRQRITGVEALMRWESLEFGMVSPAQFIPLAEESGLILDIGTWAMQEACRTLRQWRDAGMQHLVVAVNVSAAQLQHGDLSQVVERALAESGVPADCLEIELTESVIMTDPEQNADTLRACRRLGVWLAIDDFGTGYSSLAYLKRLPLTTLKIDREFISDLTHDRDDEAITSTIITMAQSLALKVIAEGVETFDQYEFLRSHGCDEVQGHWVSQALSADQCLRFIRDYYPQSAGVHAVS
ncbi:putative bifunctional diguanylate cyclase/phosphodiesterase [Pseudoxanthomonas dokdonensis]|uniref:cyclic-guanylate-specific phosphodiesterase n=1 Tax=Pseudoxanthomonas dokdonensis TaxID=344882 RepID=A0A0R0CJQ5_9GAMM|nr:GGDEF domain-containing phosphodiesterase [Pseudoxanthomonas dokdonensis]KRG70189.1 sensor protein [Pseudoxanthomonas dokdonensis]